ncbi:MAG: ABC transporter ATP-binding protein [Cyanobacteria bacterium P01_G01_bin.49]
MKRNSNIKRKTTLPGMWRLFQKFWPQICKHRLPIIGSFAALLVETSLQLLEPWPLKFIFDNVLVPQVASNSTSSFPISGLDPLILLTLLSLAIVAIAALRATAAYVSTFGMAVAVTQILAEVRAILFSHLQRLSLSFHNQFKSGDLIIRVTADIERLRIVTIKTLLPCFTNTLTLVGMLGVMFWLNWELSLIAIIAFPLLVFLTNRLIRRIRTVTKSHRKSEGAIAATAAETIGAIKIVQALSLEETFENNFFEYNTKSLAQGATTQKLSAVLQKTVDLIIAIATAFVLWRGSDLVLQQSLTPGELLVFINYLKNAMQPVRQISRQVAQITKAAASSDRILDVLENVPDVRDLPGAIAAPPLCGAIRFENVTFGHEPNRSILKNLNFEVQPGQKVGVVGPSGSGKSTLISLILRLFDPQTGSISIDWQDIRDYKLESLRRQIGVVLQDSNLFAVSVRDNIAYGTVGASERDIRRAAHLANAHDFIMELPNGYDTILNERGSNLSGGQRQRIAIARAAIRQAPIIILDEPTTALDSASEYAVSEALDHLCEGKTTFYISHNLRLVENADLILYVEGGRILERGLHSELMELGGRYAALYQLQSVANNSKKKAKSKNRSKSNIILFENYS